MASPTDTRWSAYAGQEVAGGSSTTPYNQPSIDFGDYMNATILANMASINGLVPKVSSVIIHDTMVYEAGIMNIFKRRDDPYGVASEHGIFNTGAVNKLNPGTCIPRGSVSMTGQITASNLAWNIPINIYDREINGAVMNEAELNAYVAQKMRTMQKTINEIQFNAAKVLLSDAVPGTRTVSSYTASDGTGSAVTMTSTPDGYAGKVNLDTAFTIPEITRGSTPTLAAASPYSSTMEAVLMYLQTLEAAAADMRYPGSDYNKAGIDTFSGDRPWLVMETKVLNQFDNEIANASTSNGYGFSGFPTKNAREYIARFADLIEIDAFAELPGYDNTTFPGSVDYSGDRLTAALLDKDCPWLITKFSNVEGQRCAGERMFGYSARGEQDMAIFKGANAFVMINDA